jgi:hypothetical protein
LNLAVSNPCSPSPCHNSTLCLLGANRSQTEPGYSCVCPDGLVKTVASDNKSSSAQVRFQSAAPTLQFYILFSNISIIIRGSYNNVPCNVFLLKRIKYILVQMTKGECHIRCFTNIELLQDFKFYISHRGCQYLLTDITHC